MFNIFINDLIDDIKSLNIGIDIDGENIAILLYADEVVLMAENTEDIQKLINVLDIWCNNNCLKVNLSKSNVMHFRNPSVDRSNYQFIRVITKLPNSEQSYKGKVKTHKYINRQNQSTTGKLWKS